MANQPESKTERTPRERDALVSGIQQAIDFIKSARDANEGQPELTKKANYLMSVLIEAKGRVS